MYKVYTLVLRLGPCFVLFATAVTIIGTPPRDDFLLTMMLEYLATTISPLTPCYAYTKARLASIRTSRLAVLNPPFCNILSCLMSLGVRGSRLAISFLSLPGSPHKGQLHANPTARAYLSKALLFRNSASHSSRGQCQLSIIMIYAIHIGQSTYITYTHIYNSHLQFNSSLPYREDPGNTFHVRQCLQSLALQVFGWLAITKDTAQKSPRFLQFYTFSGSQSIFGFLRCPGPRRLRASRRVLVDGDEYQIMQVGRGAFATISRVLHKPSGEVRVMKRIMFDKAGLAQEVAQAEVESLRAMAGNFWFPVLLNHFADDEEFIVTMPFYARGDMAGLLKYKGYLGSELAQFYCAQLILAIQCLHKQGIIHRDIKPDNIFLNEGGHLILADLGLAENIGTFRGTDTELDDFPIWKEAKERGGEDFPLLWADGVNPLGTHGIVGTYWYTAPEVFRNERYSFGVDYYSVGVVYYELVTGDIPFNDSEPYPENKTPLADFRWKRGQVKSPAPWEEQAILKIIAPNPGDRPQTVSKLKASALFIGVDWKKMASRDIPPPPLPLPLREG